MSVGIKALCEICARDTRLTKLKINLKHVSERLVTEWKKWKGEIYLDLVVVDPSGWGYYLQSENTDNLPVTVIPSFDTFQANWKSAMVLSPTEYDWRSFDIHCEFDKDYLDLVVRVSSEQLDMWSIDESTVSHPVLELFRSMVSAMNDLLSYTLES